MSSWFVTYSVLSRCFPFEVVLSANDFLGGYWIFKQKVKSTGWIEMKYIQFYSTTLDFVFFSAMVDSFRNINTRQMAIETWL